MDCKLHDFTGPLVSGSFKYSTTIQWKRWLAPDTPTCAACGMSKPMADHLAALTTPQTHDQPTLKDTIEGIENKYFVLKPAGVGAYAAASRAAMNKYAGMIREENPELAQQLLNWTADEGTAAHFSKSGS